MQQAEIILVIQTLAFTARREGKTEEMRNYDFRFLAETAREMEPLGSDKPDGFALPLSNQGLARLLMITPSTFAAC